jgi:hypothetical protein
MPREAPVMIATRCELLIVRSFSRMDAHCNAGSAPVDAPPLRPVACWAKAARRLVLVRCYAQIGLCNNGIRRSSDS